MKEEIAKLLKNTVKEATGLQIEPKITASSDSSQGDYSSNAPMIAFGKIKNQKSNLKSARELAEKIVEILNTKYKIPDTLEKVEVAGPGFLNFYLSQGYFGTYLTEVLRDQKKVYKAAKSSRIVLEFGDPNPFKELHIGHLRNLTTGEAYARLLESSGNQVIRANYQGDVGLHVSKALWGLLKLKIKDNISNLEKKSLEQKTEFLGKVYHEGAKAYEEDPKAKKEIESINKKIYQMDSEISELWQKGREWSLDHFEQFYKRLGIVYKKYYFESQTAPVGKEIVEDHIKDGIFEKHEGAVVFRGSHTRVFITSEGNPTYEAKDLGLAHLKEKDFSPDKSFILTANEQKEYFVVLLEALTKVNPTLGKKARHFSYGFVNLSEGKMSSRMGNVITAGWLLTEVKSRLKKEFPKTEDEVLEDLTIGAVKYSMLKFGRESDIKFDLEESIALGGNSGPYLQYTYARTQSILRKFSGNNFQFSIDKTLKLEKEEEELLRFLIHFEEVARESAEKFAPNLLCNYLYEFAQKFNLFYQKQKVIGSEREEFRLALVMGVGKVLKTGLNLLGIEAPEKI